jgi:hypothetical protein
MLGVSHLVAIALLGPLLGSTADSSTAYADHYGNDSNTERDLFGSVAVLVAASMLIWTVVMARRSSSKHVQDEVATELAVVAGMVSASAMVVAAGLLATVPLTTAIGDLTDDPGIEIPVKAGIAQAGTVVLLVAIAGCWRDDRSHSQPRTSPKRPAALDRRDVVDHRRDSSPRRICGTPRAIWRVGDGSWADVEDPELAGWDVSPACGGSRPEAHVAIVLEPVSPQLDRCRRRL